VTGKRGGHTSEDNYLNSIGTYFQNPISNFHIIFKDYLEDINVFFPSNRGVTGKRGDHISEDNYKYSICTYFQIPIPNFNFIVKGY